MPHFAETIMGRQRMPAFIGVLHPCSGFIVKTCRLVSEFRKFFIKPPGFEFGVIVAGSGEYLEMSMGHPDATLPAILWRRRDLFVPFD